MREYNTAKTTAAMTVENVMKLHCLPEFLTYVFEPKSVAIVKTLQSTTYNNLLTLRRDVAYHLGVITVDEARDLDGQHQLLVDGRVSRYLQMGRRQCKNNRQQRSH